MTTTFKSWRLERQLTQREAWEALGISRTMLKDLERGHRLDKRQNNPAITPSLTIRLAMAAVTAGLEPID